MRVPAESRFWNRISSTGTGCWLWGGTIHGKGYGAFTAKDDAHRYAYKLCIGPIPDGAELDHECRVRSCVNPWHLRIVERGWNAKQGGQRRRSVEHAKASCQRGHLWTQENTMVGTGGRRACLACRRTSNRLASARYRAKKES